MKKIYIVILIILSSSISFPQGLSVSGKVADYKSKNPLEGANVMIFPLPQTKGLGAATDKDGRFYFSSLKPGRYLMTISFVGYRTYKKEFQLISRSLDLETLYIYPEGVKIPEVEVLGKADQVQIKNDTTEINAASFKTNRDADAQDLITKMPGITVQNGTVQAQGENVKKVLVDGREYFGDDPNTVLKNIPAEIIDKIQVFDQQSDQAQFTGFDDGNTTKTINIVTRLRVRQGTFGRFFGGYGNDTRYSSGGNINFFNGDRRISILGQINNVNQQNFSSEDLLGVMSSSGRGFRMGMPRGGGGPGGPGGGRVFMGGGGFGGGNVTDFLVNQSGGLVKTKAFGINYSDKWGQNIDVTTSYFFNMTNNDAEASTDRNYFLASPTAQDYLENNSSVTQNINHRFNMRLNYTMDESNSILFIPRLTVQQNSGSSNILGYTNEGITQLNKTVSLFNSNLSAVSSNNLLLFRHRFEKRGRTLSLALNGSVNNNSGDNNLYAEEDYYGTTAAADTLNQNANLATHGYTGSASAVYTEPVSDDGLLQFDSQLSYSRTKSDQNTYDNNLLGYTSLLDTSLSNVYSTIYKTESIGTGYRFRKNELIFSANVNYHIAQLSNSQSFPAPGSIGRTFYSILPSFMMRYRISRDENLRLFYRTTNSAPSITQLQNVLNNSNPTQLSIGNPDLSQDYQHILVIRYANMNGRNMQSLFAMLGATFTQNYIGNNTIIAQNDTTVMNGIELNRGTKLSVPENLDGYINLRSFFAYGIPVEFIKTNVNLNLSINYSRTPGIINGFSNMANSATYGLGVVFSSNISEYVDYTLSSNSSINKVKNSFTVQNNSNYFTQNTSLRFFWQVWKGFFIQNVVDHQYNNGQTSTGNKNAVIWNLSIGKKFLKNDNAELLFSANDLLNQNINIQHNVSDTYTEDVRSNTLGRYFLLSLVYNVRAF